MLALYKSSTALTSSPPLPPFTELLGALSWSISMLAIPFVVSLCRKRSIRLLSIVGGLVMPLGILFTSFATEFGQVVFSYGAYMRNLPELAYH